MRLSLKIIVAGLVVLSAPAQAQSLWQRLTHVPKGTAHAADCVLDKCDTAQTGAVVPVQAGAPASEAPGNFDFYVLALSWSSGFCDTDGGGRAKTQCSIGANLGFVVHGLWPQFERGFPSDCAPGRAVSQQALAATRGLFPDTGLARYEWNKHGTCSGRAPEAYFADVARARNAVIVPAAFKAPRSQQNFAPNQIIAAFTEVNPRLRPGMLAVGCKRGVLQEVRVCFTKDLRNFRTCEEVTRQSCHARDIRVPPVR